MTFSLSYYKYRKFNIDFVYLFDNNFVIMSFWNFYCLLRDICFKALFRVAFFPVHGMELFRWPFLFADWPSYRLKYWTGRWRDVPNGLPGMVVRSKWQSTPLQDENRSSGYRWNMHENAAELAWIYDFIGVLSAIKLQMRTDKHPQFR